MSVGGELLLTIFQKHLHIRSMFFAQRESAESSCSTKNSTVKYFSSVLRQQAKKYIEDL